MTLAAIKRCVEQRRERSGISPTTGVCKFRAIDAVSSSIQLFSVFISFSVPLLLGLSFYIFLLILFFRSHNLHTCIRGGRRRWRRSWSRRVPLILSVISLCYYYTWGYHGLLILRGTDSQPAREAIACNERDVMVIYTLWPLCKFPRWTVTDRPRPLHRIASTGLVSSRWCTVHPEEWHSFRFELNSEKTVGPCFGEEKGRKKWKGRNIHCHS